MRPWPSQLTGPFTRAEGLRAGLTDADLRGSGCVRLFQNAYVPTGVRVTTSVQVRAALAIAPAGAVAARHTAALLWGAVVPPSTDVHLTLRPGTRMRVEGVDARTQRVVDAGRRGALALTSPLQTFLDLASELDLVDLVVLGDSLVRRGLVTPDELRSRAAAHRGRAGPRLRRAAALVRVGVDSPMESRLRMLLVLAGLPEPVLQHPVHDGAGRVRYRLDLAYSDWRVAVEFDGRQHAEDAAQWRGDVHRREELEAEGWRLVVVLATDLYRRPDRVLDRVVRAAADRGAVLRTTSVEWRRYFPVRD